MDSTLYNAAISGNTDAIFSQINHKSTNRVLRLHDQNLNNILHVASPAGKSEAVVAILSKHPLLVTKVNEDGNSALHLAAMGGYTHVLSALIACGKQLPTKNLLTNKIYSWKNLLRLQNKEKYTAIPEAMPYNHIEAVKLLLEQDPGFHPPPNKKGESLLYMTASKGFYDLVDLFINDCQLSNWSGPRGRSALHGAVDCNSIDCVRRLLQWDEKLLYAKDHFYFTPLHSAAYLGFGNLVSELLPVDSSKGMAMASKALLVAASAGHVSVMKQLLLHRPSCWNTRVDFERKNVLHVAIMHEKKEVIEYLLDECSTILGILLAQKDDNGNTPLHLLVIYNCCVPKLIQHPLVDKEALNYKGFTPLDLGIYNSDNRILSTSDAKNEVVEELKRAGAISHSQKSKILGKNATKDDMRKVVDNHMIVAALIATVAFTAGFAMPGGFISSGSSNAGTAVLSRNSVAFQTFVISDVVALLFSSSALFTYFITAILSSKRHLDNRKFAIYALWAMLLNMLGLGSIIVAFISGTYAVLQYSYALAIATYLSSCLLYISHTYGYTGQLFYLWLE